jgi:hypothetical protein
MRHVGPAASLGQYILELVLDLMQGGPFEVLARRLPTMPAELVSVQSGGANGVLPRRGQRTNRAILLEFDVLFPFLGAWVHESLAHRLLFRRWPLIALPFVADLTGIIQVGVRSLQGRESALRLKMIDLEVVRALVVGFMNEAVRATEGEVEAEIVLVAGVRPAVR